MSVTILLIIILLFLIGTVTGRILQVLPVIFLLGIVLFFVFGVEVFMFLITHPILFGIVILLIIFFGFKTKKSIKTRSNGKFYYYSSGNARDFEEFFRQAGTDGFQYQRQNGTFGSYQNRAQDFSNLGIREGASKEEIKKAYRDKAKLYHPDKFVNASQSERESSERMFKIINESYENLMKDFN
ncbi:MAG: DnaJ domain-containing protein [Fusobacteriaceae bacterium]